MSVHRPKPTDQPRPNPTGVPHWLPPDLMDYMAEEHRRVALEMPFEAAIVDAFPEREDSERKHGMTDYVVVPNDIRETLGQYNRVSKYQDVLTELNKGATVFVPLTNGTKGHDTAGAIRSLVITRDPRQRVVARTTTLDGKFGVVLWLREKEAA